MIRGKLTQGIHEIAGRLNDLRSTVGGSSGSERTNVRRRFMAFQALLDSLHVTLKGAVGSTQRESWWDTWRDDLLFRSTADINSVPEPTVVHDAVGLGLGIGMTKPLIQGLLDSNIVGIYLIDHANKVVDANNAFLQFVGYTREDVTSGKLKEDDLTPPEYHQFHEWASQEFRVTGVYPVYEKEFICRDSSRVSGMFGMTWLTVATGELAMAFVVNISERKRLQRKLKLSKHSNDHAGIAMFSVGRHSQILYANKAASDFLGYSQDELLSMGLPEIDLTLQAEPWDTQWEEIKRVRCFTRESLVRKKTGQHCPVEITTWHLNIEDKEYIQMFFRDTSERKRVEEQLQQSEQRYHDFVAQTAEGVWCYAFEKNIPITLSEEEQIDMFYRYGFIAECNDAMAKMYCFEAADDLLGARPAELLPRSDPINIAYLKAFIRAGYKLADQETHETDHRGEPRYFLNNLLAVIKNGEVTQVWGNQRDITDRKRAEIRLQEQAALLNEARDAIIVKDMDDRVLFWSRGAERIYGWTAEEMLGRRPIKHFYREEDKCDNFAKACRELHEMGEWSGEWKHLTKGGNEIIIQSRWTLIRDHSGEPKSIMVINTDITEKKSLEAQFFQAQRISSIGTLATGIAHDMNNILSPILMAIEALRREIKDEDMQYFLAKLKLSTQRGSDLIRQILSYAQGVAGDRVALQLRYIIHEVMGILRLTLSENIRLVLYLQEDLWPVVGDATQFSQVFMNLCVNARDAMPDGGVLKITAENITLQSDMKGRSGPFVAITISDTGTGISPDIQARIFEPFFTTKPFGKGTGLGLSSVCSIVESYGGFIDLKSEMGLGTTFIVHFPATPEPVSTTADEGVPSPTMRTGTVLIVDDEPVILTALQKGLEVFGYAALTASNVDDAITIFTANQDRISAVVTDLIMPGQRGDDFITALLEHEPGVKIIATSGLPPTGRLLEAMQKEIVKGFLRKPFLIEDLLSILDDENSNS